MSEAQHVEGLARHRSGTPTRPAALHQSRFLRVEGQAVFPDTLREHRQDPPRVVLVFEAQHRIVGIAHQEGAPPQARADTLVKPGVQDFVEEDVREQRADYSPNAKGNFQFERVIVGWRVRQVLDLRRKQ